MKSRNTIMEDVERKIWELFENNYMSYTECLGMIKIIEIKLLEDI